MPIGSAIVGEHAPQYGENFKQLALFGREGILAGEPASFRSRPQFHLEIAHLRALTTYPPASSRKAAFGSSPQYRSEPNSLKIIISNDS